MSLEQELEAAKIQVTKERTERAKELKNLNTRLDSFESELKGLKELLEQFSSAASDGREEEQDNAKSIALLAEQVTKLAEQQRILATSKEEYWRRSKLIAEYLDLDLSGDHAEPRS